MRCGGFAQHFGVVRRHIEGVFLHNQAVACVVVAFDKVPQCKALAEILVFDNCVGAQNGRIDVAAFHFCNKIATQKLLRDGVDAFYPAPQLRTEQTVGGFVGVWHAVADVYRHFALGVAVLEGRFVVEFVHQFVHAVVDGNVVTAFDKYCKPRNQRVEKLVFVGHQAVVTEDV